MATLRPLIRSFARPTMHRSTASFPTSSFLAFRTYSAGPPSKPPAGPMGPPQTMQPTNPQAVLNDLNILGSLPPALANIDGVLPNGFIFGGSTNIVGQRMGVIIIGGEVFRWYPFGIEDGEAMKVRTGRGDVEPVVKGAKEAWESAEELARKKCVLRLEETVVWGILDVIWPKPDILVLGTGARNLLISPATKKLLNDFGVRLEVSDTRNAAANYNMLGTERPGMVAAALLPANFGEKVKK